MALTPAGVEKGGGDQLCRALAKARYLVRDGMRVFGILGDELLDECRGVDLVAHAKGTENDAERLVILHQRGGRGDGGGVLGEIGDEIGFLCVGAGVGDGVFGFVGAIAEILLDG